VGRGGGAQLTLGFRTEWAPIEELEATPAAMEHAAASDDALKQVEESAMMAVDLVRLFEANDALGTTHRAAAGGAKVVSEAPRDKFLAFAFMALVNCHIAKTLEKCSVDTSQLSTALRTLHSTVCYISNCGVAQGARQ